MTRRGWSSASTETKEPEKTGPKWIPVEAPRPVFASPEEKRRLEEAMAPSRRRPNESLVEFTERALAEAGVTAIPAGTLPYRDPGEDDE